MSQLNMRLNTRMECITFMPLYHGSGKESSASQPGPRAGHTLETPGVSAALDPEVANEFATAKPGNAQANPQVYPLLHRAERPAAVTLDGTETHGEVVG